MDKPEEMQVGKVSHYFSKIGVAVIDVTDGSIKVGDKIHIKGHTTDFMQKVSSMQIEQDKIEIAEPGQSIGMKVSEPVRQHDIVYKAI
jgi:putative protease